MRQQLVTHSVIIQEDTVVAVKFAIVYCWVKACTEVINRLRSLVLMPTMLHLAWYLQYISIGLEKSSYLRSHHDLVIFW